jgi:hypothetical protein
MTFILRWPSILALLALVLLCILGAVAAAGVLTGVTAPGVGVLKCLVIAGLIQTDFKYYYETISL